MRNCRQQWTFSQNSTTGPLQQESPAEFDGMISHFSLVRSGSGAGTGILEGGHQGTSMAGLPVGRRPSGEICWANSPLVILRCLRRDVTWLGKVTTPNCPRSCWVGSKEHAPGGLCKVSLGLQFIGWSQHGALSRLRPHLSARMCPGLGGPKIFGLGSKGDGSPH